MTYEQNVSTLATRTADAIEGLWTRHREGQLSLDEFKQSTSLLLTAARAKGVAVSELTLAGYLQEALGFVPAFAGLPVVDVTPRLEKALTTITTSDLDTVMQLRRLGESEVLEAAANGFSEAIRLNPRVTGYTRGLEADHCELCMWLYKDGYVYPADKPMNTHKGCKCHPVPVTN
ncbi:hypothetical protein IWX63_001290 [Arthrobacter sp. CAN_A2]|uniref:VG15 protein n=1 Tax=Arthrobacter sp. CAN_A2 TaxID=2787718 RepID=UPI0018EFEDD5